MARFEVVEAVGSIVGLHCITEDRAVGDARVSVLDLVVALTAATCPLPHNQNTSTGYVT